jgi:hypothetical protein
MGCQSGKKEVGATRPRLRQTANREPSLVRFKFSSDFASTGLEDDTLPQVIYLAHLIGPGAK